MATCERSGKFGVTIYKRHKFKNGVCKCGVVQKEHLRAVANRRYKRKHDKTAAAQVELAMAGIPQV